MLEVVAEYGRPVNAKDLIELREEVRRRNEEKRKC